MSEDEKLIRAVVALRHQSNHQEELVIGVIAEAFGGEYVSPEDVPNKIQEKSPEEEIRLVCQIPEDDEMAFSIIEKNARHNKVTVIKFTYPC